MATGTSRTSTAGRRTRWLTVVVVVALVALLAVVALAIGRTGHRYQQDLELAQARISTGNHLAQTRCGPIEYAIAGTGPVVLVVHGAGGGFDQGLEIGAGLVRHGFRIVAVSRFGYLQTPLPADASPAAQADAHACLLDALGLDQVGVLGASAGAPSSVQFAIRHPHRVNALVLLVPAIYVPRDGAAPSVHTPAGVQWLFDHVLRSDLLLWLAIRLAPEHLVGSILATPRTLLERADAAERARAHRMLQLTLPISRRRPGLLNEARIMASLVRDDLERIAAPTLAISAADDRFGTYDSAQYTAAQIPGARFMGFDDGGHLLVGHQQEVESAIAAWLSRRQTTPAAD